MQQLLGSLENPLINWKVHLKLRWTKHCVLVSAGFVKDRSYSTIIFTNKETKIYVPVVTLPAKENQKPSTPLSKGFKRSFFRVNIKIYMRREIRQMSIDIF